MRMYMDGCRRLHSEPLYKSDLLCVSTYDSHLSAWQEPEIKGQPTPPFQHVLIANSIIVPLRICNKIP